MPNFSRRTFLRSTLATAAAATLAPHFSFAEETKKPNLKKSMKYDMVNFGSSIDDKFDIIKSVGFEGVEINSPSDIDKDAARKASDRTGVKIHGTIDSVHWKDTLSDPDQAVRDRGVEALKTALRDAKFYGGDTALLVPGKVADRIPFEDVWSRSQAEIKKAIPLADELGVKIAIEVVWNNFITKPEQLVKYVDEFQSKSVGAYFDCSNMLKYGVSSADWIRALGPRMLKVDFKGYSAANPKHWVPIGEGDENWPEILKALEEVNYHSYLTAEVPAKDLDELKDIYNRMNKIIG